MGHNRFLVADIQANAARINSVGRLARLSRSNAMCTIAAQAEVGRLPLSNEERDVLLETPGGLTRLRVSHRHGKLISVAYDALPGFVVAEDTHPGVICHSPTGTGTTVLLAWLERRGEIEPGSAIRE